MTLDRVDVARRPDLSQLDYTYDLLSGLTDDELEAVQEVAIVFIKRKKGSDNTDAIAPFQPQTEEQLLARIDHSISQIDPDSCEDLDDVVAEMMPGIDG